MLYASLLLELRTIHWWNRNANQADWRRGSLDRPTQPSTPCLINLYPPTKHPLYCSLYIWSTNWCRVSLMQLHSTLCHGTCVARWCVPTVIDKSTFKIDSINRTPNWGIGRKWSSCHYSASERYCKDNNKSYTVYRCIHRWFKIARSAIHWPIAGQQHRSLDVYIFESVQNCITNLKNCPRFFCSQQI